ncbi:MAG: RICIN domain-containing protein [Fibrobacterales bacterium]
MKITKYIQSAVIAGLVLVASAVAGYQVSEIATTNADKPLYAKGLENGTVYWVGYQTEEDQRRDLFKSDVQEYTNITNTPSEWENYTAVDGETYVYLKSNGIFFYNGTQDIHVLDIPVNSMGPMDLDNGQFVFPLYDGNDNEIMLFNGTELIQITDNDREDVMPRIHNGEIVWKSYDTDQFIEHLYYYKADGTTQLISDDVDYGFPAIENGVIAWTAPGAGDESDIFVYQNNTIQNISQTTVKEQDPQINNGIIAWKSRYYELIVSKSHIEHFEIMLYEGTEAVSITGQDRNYKYYSLDDGEIIISGYNKEDYSSFIAHYNGTTLNTISAEAETSYSYPLIENGMLVWTEYNYSVDRTYRIMTAKELVFDPTATYKIISRHSGKAIDLQTESAQWNGGYIQQWDFYGAANQLWNIIATESGFKIINALSGKALDVEGYSTSNGARVHQWDYVGGANQQWNFVSQTDGSVAIENVLSGKVIDIADFATSNSSPLHQWDFVGGENQKWDIIIVE